MRELKGDITHPQAAMVEKINAANHKILVSSSLLLIPALLYK